MASITSEPDHVGFAVSALDEALRFLVGAMVSRLSARPQCQVSFSQASPAYPRLAVAPRLSRAGIVNLTAGGTSLRNFDSLPSSPASLSWHDWPN
jgi:hypothetical protein